MPLYRPSELKNFLIENGVSPKKVLSQNFLIDGNVLKKIIHVANIQPSELILEIGPGPGALTEQLLNSQASVIAVEKDRDLCRLLPRLSEHPGALKVCQADIMDFPIHDTLKSLLKNQQKAKVVANLPYHLTTPILEKIVPMRDTLSKVVVMVQDEVARRFTAKPGTSDYSSFTVFLNYYADCHYAFQVKRNSFHPAPKVDSAIVVLDLKQPPKVSDETRFFNLTRTAFQMRRKMLRRSLIGVYPKETIVYALEQLNMDPHTRPEQLSLEQFVELFETLERAISQK
ncbi:MAG: 16S rRNA (adenine(1518)-N(6)/adenine(1519)-N(6))-dimethyltransferase RsmA [Chlamydiota bacterium]|nr:16S rRNA (adenine(1518)-N(6)/adenine(1519)-N(6))-dimethyltransferase RsmA [Chlamydiota bacterium]